MSITGIDLLQSADNINVYFFTATLTTCTRRETERITHGVILRPEGYVGLVDHALAEREVGVRQIGQSLEQNLCRDGGLEVRRVELVPENTSTRPVNQTQSFYRLK